MERLKLIVDSYGGWFLRRKIGVRAITEAAQKKKGMSTLQSSYWEKILGESAIGGRMIAQHSSYWEENYSNGSAIGGGMIAQRSSNKTTADCPTKRLLEKYLNEKTIESQNTSYWKKDQKTSLRISIDFTWLIVSR